MMSLLLCLFRLKKTKFRRRHCSFALPRSGASGHIFYGFSNNVYEGNTICDSSVYCVCIHFRGYISFFGKS